MAIETERRARLVGISARLAAALGLALLLALPAAGQSLSPSLQAIADFGPNPGGLDMYVHVPDGHEPNSGLVVALHGCAQAAADFDDETGLIAFADAFGFVLLLPEQREANNPKRCFNWFQREDNQRDQGESGSLRSMIRHAIDAYDVDASQVFVLGLSAGGSMASVLMANYPELFQGGAIVAGTPYECNNPGFLDGLWWWLFTWAGDAAAASYACGLFDYSPTQRPAEAWGDYVRAAAGATPANWPRVSLWQGGADGIVDPANLRELVKQWTDVHGIDQNPDQTQDTGAITHTVYRDASGAPRVETYEIAGFPHAFAVDPGTGPEQCGTPAPFVEDADICSALMILRFWGVAP